MTTKPEPIRLLLAEDNPADVELEMRELRRAGLHVAHRVAHTKESFTRELEEFAPEVILSDFSIPRFDGKHALRIARERAPETPFIFVSGTIGRPASDHARAPPSSEFAGTPA